MAPLQVSVGAEAVVEIVFAGQRKDGGVEHILQAAVAQVVFKIVVEAFLIELGEVYQIDVVFEFAALDRVQNIGVPKHIEHIGWVSLIVVDYVSLLGLENAHLVAVVDVDQGATAGAQGAVAL